MIQSLKYIQLDCTQPISIFCDNTISINISKDIVMKSIINHIPIKYHFLREQVLDNVVKLEYVPIHEKIAEIFAKPLP